MGERYGEWVNAIREQKNQTLEDLLGLNVPADRIVIGAVDANPKEVQSTLAPVNWKKYAVYRPLASLSYS